MQSFSWTPGVCGAVVTGCYCGAPGSPLSLAVCLFTLCSPVSMPLQGSQPRCWLTVVAFPLRTSEAASVGMGFATQLLPVWTLEGSRSCWGPACPCPCLLPCPSAEHAPTGGTQQHNFTILPWFGERLKHLTRSLERPFTNIFCLQQTCDLPYLITGDKKASWHGQFLSALDLVAA